ncbi:disease resistance protein At4g27190-like [Silene latifolia]|uniref:disease resistance protein At4g27190-like n=1 Tax=Silene latifolia TaxID=37657 RepID=UPI003D783228
MASIPVTILTGGASQAAGTLVGPAADAGKGIYKSLKRKYDYIQNLDHNFKHLEEEARYLTSRKKDVDDVIASNPILDEKTHECKIWLEDVEKITASLNDMRIKYQNINTTSGLSGLRTRLKLSKQVVKMTKSVVELRGRINHEPTILKERIPDKFGKFPKNISEVHSLGENVEKLIELLSDDMIKKIGIWGLPGVGKTTILENLYEEVAKRQMFDYMFWVTVTKEGGLDHIQETILKRLTSKGNVINDRGQASAFISETLAKKKYLLVLDGVFSKIELRHIGIHDGHMHGKVVLATRERTLCYVMEMEDDIKIEKISRDDARKLFRHVVGKVVDHPTIAPIAERIVIQCGEQPQVIKGVGSYLKGKLNEDLWQSTLSKLQSPNMYRLNHLEDLFGAFKLIYEELHDSLKECLLYGASFPEDSEIYRDYLVDCWRTEQLIGIGQTLRKACEEGHTNLEDLIDKCLFDQCQSIKHVKMPVIFRNAAVRMALLRNYGLLFRDEEDLERLPSSFQWENGRVVSLMNSNLIELPERPECPRISTLFLQKNDKLSVIPASFFDLMPTLKTLDLYGTGIKELPPSVSKLTNLRGLYLNECRLLVNLPSEVRELHSLVLLDICRSGIYGIPCVIGELTSLECLRVSFASNVDSQNLLQTESIKMLPKIFDTLIRLEELAIVADPKDSQWNMISLSVAAKLANLRKLSALTFYFPNPDSLEAFIKTSISWNNGTCHTRSNFRSFNIYVGSHPNNSTQIDVSKCSGRRYLQYSKGEDIPFAIKEVLKTACAFELINHQDITNFSHLGIDGMRSLEICVVEGCHAMEVMVDSSLVGNSVLPWLKELHLLKLNQLMHISRGSVPQDSFGQLTKLILCECPKLSQALSWEMVKELKELQHLRVQNCPLVTEVFEVGAVSTPLCPKLQILELVNLESLLTIHNGNILEWAGLQKIETIECDKLDNLCLNETNTRKLRSIKCSKVWWETLTFSGEIRTHLLPFCCFVEDI